jgi:putative hemolysin
MRDVRRRRLAVFALEIGACLSTPKPGHDVDVSIDYGKHLLARDVAMQAVVGTCCVLTPDCTKGVNSGAPTTSLFCPWRAPV